ncbi:MAG: helix-turn-helix transcriptional regulator [Rhodobacteraceae bacterium]|nr:helix-turn-helix transcriptional regulator [Paracoccaceae bacterium]
MIEQFGEALKSWRTRRRMSQLDLGLSADVSSRHISFLETGRARPSRRMVLRLCEELEVPHAARNHLLIAAGMAPAYGRRPLSAEELRPAWQAVEWILERHAPFPAIAFDRHWKLLSVNPTAEMMMEGLGVKTGDSMILALAENETLRASIDNLEEVVAHLVMRLRTELTHFGDDQVLEAGIAALSETPTPTTAEIGLLPAFAPSRYRMGGQVFSLLSTFTQFGTAEDVALSELRVEMMFPADEMTRNMLHQIAP